MKLDLAQGASPARTRPGLRPAVPNTPLTDGPTTRGRRGRRISAWLATLVLALGAVALTSASAQASTPRCNSYAIWASKVQPAQTDIYLPTSNNGWGTWKCVMSYGDHNAGVAELQRGLNLCYGTSRGADLDVSLKVDGIYGSATKAAVIKVQRYHTIVADGVYGPQTAAASWHRGWTKSPYGWYWTCNKPSSVGLY